ncbi:glycosyltransferase family 9 protein [Marinilabilia salmonicolor]|uniref:glycosyltransferase family 9 protein n=1 Tax=Marinilabilia salmonicolor TaxID=989 RepID=UPI00029B314A|nr:glycosyltransferase family 9 protein [Marinilabilia salmonicolor]
MKKRILVFRFSALGDVAMTVPVLWSFLDKYPDHEIWFVSRPFAKDLVAPLPRVHFFPVDLKQNHKGLPGLYGLFRELKKMGPWEAVVDLHSVLRTHVLTSLFAITGTKVAKIDKGRSEKKKLTRKDNKVFKALPTTADRYRQTFGKAGLPFELQNFPGKTLYGKDSLDSKCPPWGNLGGSPLLVGIAPFAKHQWKMWPEEKMLELLKLLDERGVSVILFGGPGEEQKKLEGWVANLGMAQTFAGKLTMSEELELMSQLNIMVSMDSANMHLASLSGIRVVSIWGATHPYAGFMGYGQSQADAVQVNLDCRPCSVFGNIPCHRGDFACMERITADMVLERILEI